MNIQKVMSSIVNVLRVYIFCIRFYDFLLYFRVVLTMWYFFFFFLSSYPVPDLPLCLGVLKHRAPMIRGTMDFCLCGAILYLKASCF